MRELKCLRCGEALWHMGDETFQLGQTGWILGDLPNLIAGGLQLSVYVCPACGKVELFRCDESESGIQQRPCPRCGKMHDIDYPRCPFCKYDYREEQ